MLRRWIRVLAVIFLIEGAGTYGYAQVSQQELYLNQMAHYFNGLANPAAANLRVRNIFLELVGYSNHAFPVYPAQQFTAGQATLGGIYLDISIAADPSVEVTRFFLAHEWGHMMHGDPLNELTPLGRYRMAMGARAAEDNADTYAATYMRYRNHDIRPVIDFFCALPDFGPGDSHSSGVDRAKHVAAIYGVPDKHVDVPCADNNNSNGNASEQATGKDANKTATENSKESARSECRDKYSDCINDVMSADQCVENNVRNCTKACAPNPYRCPDGCDESRFSGTCHEIERDKKQRCREKRDDCLKAVDEDN